MLNIFNPRAHGRRLAYRITAFGALPEDRKDSCVKHIHIRTVVDLETLLAVNAFQVLLDKNSDVLPDEVTLKIKNDCEKRESRSTRIFEREVSLEDILNGEDVWPDCCIFTKFFVFSIVDIKNEQETYDERLAVLQHAYEYCYDYDVMERIAALRATAGVDVAELRANLPSFDALASDALPKIKRYLSNVANFNDFEFGDISNFEQKWESEMFELLDLRCYVYSPNRVQRISAVACFPMMKLFDYGRLHIDLEYSTNSTHPSFSIMAYDLPHCFAYFDEHPPAHVSKTTFSVPLDMHVEYSVYGETLKPSICIYPDLEQHEYVTQNDEEYNVDSIEPGKYFILHNLFPHYKEIIAAASLAVGNPESDSYANISTFLNVAETTLAGILAALADRSHA